MIEADDSVRIYLDRFTSEQRKRVFEAEQYRGIAAEKAEKIADYWDKVLFKGGDKWRRCKWYAVEAEEAKGARDEN